MAELKTKRTDASVEKFLRSVTNEQRRRDCAAVMEMMEKATGEKPRMWGPTIVGFGSYRYKCGSGREGEWFLTGVSPRKQALTLYIMPGFAAYGDLMAKLGKHKTGKSCLYVNKLEDLDQAVLRKLIRSSVAYMKQKK